MIPALVWLAAFAANLVFMAPDQALEDTAEMIACALSLGNAHPPGYPIHALLGRLFVLLPAGSVGFRLNLMSASASALAACLAFAAVRELGRRPGASHGAATAGGLGAAAAYAVLPTAWWHGGMADKYPLFMAAFALGAFVICRGTREGSRERSGAAFAVGLGLTLHLMGLYLIPVFLLVLRRAGRRAMAVSLFLACLPLTLRAAYPVIRASAHPGVDYGVCVRAGALLRYAGVAAYGDRFYGPGDAVEMARKSLSHAARTLGREAGPQLALAAAGVLALRVHAWPAVAGALVLAAANIAIAMPFRDAQAYGQVYLPVLWVISVLAGAGSAALGALWRPAAAAALVVAAGQAAVNAPAADQGRAYAAPDHARNLTVLLPPRALVVAHDEIWLAPLWYLRESEPRWRGLILATRDHLNPLKAERKSLERALGSRAALLGGYEDGPPIFPRLALAAPEGVFCGFVRTPLPSTGVTVRGLLARITGGSGPFAADRDSARIWRAIRLRDMWGASTRRSRTLVHAYAGLMHEAGLVREGRRLDPGFPARGAAMEEALAAAGGDRKAAAGRLADRGLLLSSQERYFEAVRSWEDALRLDPRAARAMNGMGELALTEERFADAGRWFSKACGLEPSPGCREGIERARTAARAAASLPRLARAAADSPGATAFCDLGNAYWNLLRLRCAEIEYRKAIAVDPGYARAWGNLGSSLAEQARLAEAALAYRRALALAPENADTVLNLAVVYGRMGKVGRAKRLLARVLEMRPGDPAASSLLEGMGR